ncbi:MAG: hypothetical protein AAFP97_02450, partial [Pseudomonadota bacterium]
MAIDWDLAHINIVILLSEGDLSKDFSNGWKDYLSDIQQAVKSGQAHILNVALTKSGIIPGFEDLEVERYFSYREKDNTCLDDGGPNEPMRRLLLSILSFTGIILRKNLPLAINTKLSLDPNRPVKVFLSHSKRSGQKLAECIHDHLLSIKSWRTNVGPFLDSESLKIGHNFQKDFENNIKNGVFIAVQTDDYATRRFCRWEMMCAKRHRRPILVAHLLQKGEGRAFPYAGNTPYAVVSDRFFSTSVLEQKAEGDIDGNELAPADPADEQLAAEQKQAIDLLLINLMSETLRFILFECEVQITASERNVSPAAILPRPPELADLAYVMQSDAKGRDKNHN